MNLTPTSVFRKIPPLYAQDNAGDSAVVHAKWFTIVAPNFRWYVLEYDPADRMAFAFVTSDMLPQGEFGYVSVTELRSLGRSIERDLHWTPCTMEQLRKSIREYGYR